MRRSLLSELQNQFPTVSKKELHALVLCGEITVNGELMRDPKQLVPVGARIEKKSTPFVSRGGDKLEAALRAFPFDVEGKILLDAGASTGGFTDCLLRHGASFVHAIDSGHNQIHYRLRRDPRVLVQEDTPVQSVRSLDPRPDAAVCDISFRSIRDIAGQILKLTAEGCGVFLVKPQFEWLDPASDFDGVVVRPDDLRSILRGVFFDFLSNGIEMEGGIESPVTGHRGNREFLVLVRLQNARDHRADQELSAAVADSLVDCHKWMTE